MYNLAVKYQASVKWAGTLQSLNVVTLNELDKLFHLQYCSDKLRKETRFLEKNRVSRLYFMNRFTARQTLSLRIQADPT